MLDSQTALLLSTLLFFVLPVMVWLNLPRPVGREVDMWCLGSLMAGVGLVLLATQRFLPGQIWRHLANTIILGYCICCIQSLRMTLGRPWPAAVWWFWMLMAFLFYSVLSDVASVAWRGTIFRFVQGCLIIYSALWSWRVFRRMGSVNAAAIATAHLTLGMAFATHSVLTAGRLADSNPFRWDASVLALVIMVASVVTNLCYVGMMLDLAARERLQAQQAEQAAQETQWLGTQITHLDRRGRMAIASASLAHELNQPLTAATMNAQLAERQWSMSQTSTPLLLELLAQVQSGIERTASILQRIRRGSEFVVSNHESVDLQAVLDRALLQMAPELRRLAVTVTQDRPPQRVWCLGDELGLSQVVVNLLRNALQAMAEQTERRLWVACTVEQGTVSLRIRDAGAGMSDKMLARWGEPFLSSRDEGMGLGLAISRDIVTRHQGQLRLHNHPQGGLEAVLSLPQAAAKEA